MAGLAEQLLGRSVSAAGRLWHGDAVAPVTGLNGRDGNGSLIQPLYK